MRFISSSASATKLARGATPHHFLLRADEALPGPRDGHRLEHASDFGKRQAFARFGASDTAGVHLLLKLLMTRLA